MQNDYALCRSCRKKIRWVTMVSGKKNPLDPEPVENGNVQILELSPGEFQGEALKAEQLAAARDGGELLYISHFATCPTASQHRSK